MAPHITEHIGVVPSPVLAEARLSLDPALLGRGTVDGAWWPRSREASVEFPILVAALNDQVGAILRLGVDVRDWDSLPRRIRVGGRVVRVGWFANVNHKIIVTRGRQDHVLLLVVPPGAPAAAAKSALALAGEGGSRRPEEILAAAGLATGTGDRPPERTVAAGSGRLEGGTPPPDHSVRRPN
ncbi:DUF5994 family protein [Actinomadura sp. DC4]|uniref:DUF5994 family protein n=1 Tax=Actinomadura sp. DC4 TaxID=3055069 RepID=UPI0025B24B08|nr:DUF5994 family protein [Actinomadura sp. DC4]MDN3352003.1 DUF5994 family protein [Actinomadura sp. DC4]